jgi:ribosome maturation factor RimP
MDTGSLSAIAQAVEAYIQPQGIELVDLTSHREGARTVVRVFVDLPEGGITMDTCARINRELGELFEQRAFFDSSYVLEVSSPGLDRALRTARDFLRVKGRPVRFFLNQAVAGKIEWMGVITDANEEKVTVRQDGETDALLEIPLAAINKARLEL